MSLNDDGARLSDRQDQLTDKQREAFERFRKAREAFGDNAESMFAALYPAEHISSEVPP